MLVASTHHVEGRPVKEHLGLVTGEVIVGANFFRDIFASVTDFVGGRSGKYEKVLKRGREEALYEMQMEAVNLGANAVIAVNIDYGVVGSKGSMMLVSVTGTAVRI
ncbi:hypothetical protein LPB140_11830 [Sphingorhabdus lutea]|uniref:UPF0145 protein LPB140_11830 n=1 Tax=Sphingorhabdus lutea TaxID=1913578 RepID=A0A1L3JFF6_9SPHN|nr:YbjQ family protein [Sphingorhabdus lutea]APG63839.1 hypothetical protein LPB140_11830 [Sphingorhabdus lutea]